MIMPTVITAMSTIIPTPTNGYVANRKPHAPTQSLHLVRVYFRPFARA